MNQPINRPAHRNTDSEKTGVIPPVSNIQPADQAITAARRPVLLVPYLALVVLLVGINGSVWLATDSMSMRVLVGTFGLTALLLAASNGVQAKGKP